MQAVALISIFALFLSLVTGIIVTGSKNVEQLKRIYEIETAAWFQRIADVVLNDLTPSHLHSLISPGRGPNIISWLNNTPELNALNFNGTFPAHDAWRRPITGAASIEQRVLNRNAFGVVEAPIAAIALISGGPNGVVETPLANQLAAMPLTNANVMGLESFRSGDDIVLTFTDEASQQRTWQVMKARVDRIGQAALKNYQAQLRAYQTQLGDAYTNNLISGLTSSLTTQLATDPNAPKFNDLSNFNNISALGVSEEFEKLTDLQSDNSRFALTATTSGNGQTLTLTLTNDTVGGRMPTPWANVIYSINLTGASN
jgi:hypothetical protein